MSDKIVDVKSMSFVKLVGAFLSKIKRFLSLEKELATKETTRHLKTAGPWLGLIVAGLVLLCLGGIFILVTAVLVLNIWFAPWASALIVTAALLLLGLIMGVIGALFAKKGIDQAKATLNGVAEDLRWLRKK
jgi:VIT1/CCC1 family predicted Fe2+/Mn2+ transporter